MLFKGKQPLIYIIDNNISYRKVIAGCMDANNLFNIRMFNSGEQCISDATKKADIIVLENNLGEGKWTGLEFMMKYKKVYSETNFLFYTSTSETETAVNVMRLGALHYILKSKKGLSELSAMLDKLSQYYQKKSVNQIILKALIGILLLLITFLVFMTINYKASF